LRIHFLIHTLCARHSPPRSYLTSLLIEWSDSTDVHSFLYRSVFACLDCDCTILVYIRYSIWSCTRCWQISGEFSVFPITLGLQPYINKEFVSCFHFNWTYWLCPVFFFVFVFDPKWLWRQYCGSYLCQKQGSMVLPVVLCDRCFL
jgi:hypothetical protein